VIGKVARNASPLLAGGAIYAALSGLGHEKAIVGAIFAFTVALWITEILPIAVTALFSSALLIFAAAIPEKEVLGAYGDPIIPLFIGSFILAKAMELTGLSDRFALFMLRQPWANRSPGALLFAMGLVSCLISLLVSNTATTAMMLPIGLSVLGTIGIREKTKPFAIAMMLMLTWSSSVAVGMPVGTPPNLIGIGLIEKATGERIGFVHWMAFGMPITFIVMGVCWALLRTLYGKEPPSTVNAASEASRRLAELGPMRASERVVLFAFVVALGLWIIPDSCEILFGKQSPITAWWQSRFPASVAALVAAAIVFLLPAADREQGRAIVWKEAASIDWGTILLFGAGIALGQALFSTGLAKELGEMAAAASGARTLLAVTCLCTAAAIILSELASNTAAATTMVPVAIGLAEGASVSPYAPALGAALGASFGFMLPVSTAPNAIVYSTGLVPSREMLKSGFLLDIVAFLVIVACLMTILPMLGY